MKQIGLNSLVWVSKYIDSSENYQQRIPKVYKHLEIVSKEAEGFINPIRCTVIEIYETFSKEQTVVLVTAPLTGSGDHFFSIECRNVNGVLVPVSDVFFIALKKSEILRNLRKVFRKFMKQLKINHKYNKMNKVINYLFVVERRRTIRKMIENNPENFV